jgi:hypothetical protein
MREPYAVARNCAARQHWSPLLHHDGDFHIYRTKGRKRLALVPA